MLLKSGCAVLSSLLLMSKSTMITAYAVTLSFWYLVRSLKSNWPLVGLKLSPSLIQDGGILIPGLVSMSLAHDVVIGRHVRFVLELLVVSLCWNRRSALDAKLRSFLDLTFLAILSVIATLEDGDGRCWFLVTDGIFA